PARPGHTPDQAHRLHEVSARVREIYPRAKDEYRRDAAIKAAAAYLRGRTTPSAVAQELARARRAALAASSAAMQVAALAVGDGLGEVQAARQAGITRRTLRTYLGRRTA